MGILDKMDLMFEDLRRGNTDTKARMQQRRVKLNIIQFLERRTLPRPDLSVGGNVINSIWYK